MQDRSTLYRLKRIAVGAALAASLVALSGCVYLRLLRFKNQLREFDEYVQVDKQAGLGLTFSEAVLEDGDFVYITESQPTSKAPRGAGDTAEQWIWKFVKERADEGDRPFGVVFKTHFQDHLLTRIDFDPQIIEIIPPDFVVTMFKSMGKAKINKIRRSATAEVGRDSLDNVPLPTFADIQKVMGEPSKIEVRQGATHWTYVFNFYNPENDELSGQFKIVFKGDDAEPDSPIDGFAVTGKAR